VQASTLAASTADLQLDLSALATAQRTFPSVKALHALSSLSLQAFTAAGGHIICDVPTGTARIVVLSSHQRSLFKALHRI